MKLSNYAFLTDENIHPIIVQSLRLRGCDVFDVKEEGLNGNTDTFLLALATDQNRVVLTHDSDFGTLVIADGKPFIGIVYLKPGHILPRGRFDILKQNCTFVKNKRHDKNSNSD